MKNDKIKILILNFNGLKFIKECLDSVLKIDYPNFSVTVIDNSSTDDSINFIKSNYPDVKIVLTDKNRFFSGGYNYYFDRFRDDCYYLLLNNDTIVTKNLLKNFILGPNQFGQRNIYGSTINYENNRELIWYSGGEVELSSGIIRHLNIRQSINDVILKDSPTGYISGCCMFLHSSIINELNGFDEKFRMYMEDVDFCLRAQLKGIKSYYLVSPKLFHHVSGSVKFKLFKIMSSYIKLSYKHLGIVGFLSFPLFLLRKLFHK